MKAQDRIIVALDVPTAAEMQSILDAVGDMISHFKVGSELFTALGPRAVEMVHRKNAKVFLDLKFHDIPNTVASAVKRAAELGVWMLNVHGSGGREMMEAAVDAAHAAKRSPLVIAVTVLTSFSDKTLRDIGVLKNAEDQVIDLARLAQDAGLAGVVASPREAAAIRKALGKKFLIVTPGVRPAGAGSQDQVRTATPREALQNGADYMVIGRPITAAKDPRGAVKDILKEVE